MAKKKHIFVKVLPFPHPPLLPRKIDVRNTYSTLRLPRKIHVKNTYLRGCLSYFHPVNFASKIILPETQQKDFT